MRKCPKCKVTKERSGFNVNNNREDGMSFYCTPCTREVGRKSYQKRKVLKPKNLPTTKVCGDCKKEFPRTKRHFFTKKYKQKLSDGTIKEYTSLRSNCKDCHAIRTTKKKQEKKCLEMGWKIEDYQDKWRELAAKNQTKYEWVYQLDIPIGHKRTLIRYLRNGYVFTTLNGYYKERERVKKESFARKRKQPIPDEYDYKYQMPKKLRNEYQNKELSDSRLANWLGFKVSEVTKEVIETKRLLVKMNRYIKSIQ